jgi:hypothetical protein
MKRLLLGPALALPLILGLCSFHNTKVPELPKVPEVVREIPLDDFKQFPPIPAVPSAPKPQVKAHAPALAPRHHVRPSSRPVRPRRAPEAPSVDATVPDQQLPPQQGPICIFPFSMIPNCTPQVAGQ